MSGEQGSPMTTERALALYGQSSSWLRDRIGTKCACGHCHVCAYNHLSAISTENAELKRQLERRGEETLKYGQHFADCPRANNYYVPCGCGFSGVIDNIMFPARPSATGKE